MNRFGGLPLRIVVAVLALGALAGGWAQAREPRVILAASRVPSDVMAFLRRKSACERLAENDDDLLGRLTEAVQSRRRLNCSLIPDEERRLRARYADEPAVLEVIDRGDD